MTDELPTHLARPPDRSANPLMATSAVEKDVHVIYILQLENIYEGPTMTTQERPPLFTAAEAAVLTRLPVKAVNNAIDKKTIAAHVRHRRGEKSLRLVTEPALLYLALERELVGDTTPSFRQRLFKAINAARTEGVQSVVVGALTLDLRPGWRVMAQRIKDLRRAEVLASADPEVLGGVPVFRGTRIPIHMIAELLSQGETLEALRRGYPRLTDEMIRLAPLYAGAHPLRGRPRKQPWRGRSFSRTGRLGGGNMRNPSRVSRFPVG
ncbi:MAG TPA: DUF433 domain-containing protein [Candidatus Binataceae bacterium]